jgi:cytochrome P450
MTLDGEEAFDPYAPSSANRYREMADIRAAGGVRSTVAGYFVATAAGVESGLRDVEKFVGSFTDTSVLPDDDVVISAIPEPRHGRIRRVINTVVALHRANDAEPFIRTTTAGLIDEALRINASSGWVDLVATVVDPLPSAVIAHLLGAPVEDQEQFRIWSDELLERQSSGEPMGLVDLHPEFAAYIFDLIDRHRESPAPPDDVITRFLSTAVDGEHLSDRAVCTQTMFLIISGNETTRNLIGNALHALATDPALYARVRADRALVPIVVEESLRHDSPVQVLGRAVLADTEIGGVALHPGDRVVFGIASANRDESVFAEPERFSVDRRRPREHLAFGSGPHVCPGATLARLEANTVLEALCDRVAALALADGFVPVPNPVFWALGHRRLDATLVASD